MPNFEPTRLLFPCLFVVSFLLAGCGGSSDGPSLGDWTLEAEGITLSKDLQVSETENYFFGSIGDLDVTTEGRMVVLDTEANHLKVLRSDGTLIDTLGRGGQGPGEFRGPQMVEVARGDSVYVFDNQLERITVFTPPPSSQVARSVVIPGDKGYPTKVRVLEEGFAGQFSPGYSRKEGLRRPSPASWHLIRETGAAGDSLFRERRLKVATSFGGPGVVIAYLPFGRFTRVAAGSDSRLYHSWPDSLQIKATSLDGTTEVIASVPTAPVPVTEAERDSALKGISTKIRGEIEAAFPETKPALTDLVVADDGRLWVQRPAQKPDPERSTWWILDADDKTIHEIRLPREVRIEVVRNGMAYGVTTTVGGAPALVRYRIQT